MNFSALNRAKIINEMSNQSFDLLIIGGGITGAGIALDAASRGLKTALVEKRDFAWGTSSRSTKLIHGGLRYLKQFEIGLVREVGTERAIVHRNARHIVIPEKMLLPIVENGSLGKTMSSIGLWVYDFLADVESDEKRRMLSKEATLKSEPLLRKDIVKGGGLYFEYRSDDARLTIENMKTAVNYGANCLNYGKCVDFIFNENEKIEGAIIEDKLNGGTFAVKAKYVINAAGPWVDKVRGMDKEAVKGKRLHLTKGIHLVVPRERLPLQQSVYFDVNADKRMVFAIPRGQITYVGTTDTSYYEEINRPRTSAEDVEYVLAATNAMFPGLDLKLEDVISSWAGLRPLIHEDGKSPSELSRKDEIFYSKTGLISIAGGKLTGYRKMAERTVDAMIAAMGNVGDKPSTIQACKTEHIRISGGDFDSQKALETFIVKRIGECTQIGLDKQMVIDLVHKYGSNTDLIIEKAFELYPTEKDAVKRIHKAELWYAINYEMVNTLNDYLIRRTGRLYFERPPTGELYGFIAEEMAKLLDWDEARVMAEKLAFEREYKEVVEFLEKEKVEV